MPRRVIVVALGVALTGVVSAAGIAEQADPLAAFTAGLDSYVELHRRAEGPVPPLAASKDMNEVLQRMEAVRTRIRAAGIPKQGHLLTREVTSVFRQRIASVLTRETIVELTEDIEEHTPPGMPPLRVFEPLPEDAPFGPVPPRLFERLPELPDELRYVILARALVLWDHHANLIVDIGPTLFDATTYKSR